MSKVAVVGAAGFIGRFLTDVLCQQGETVLTYSRTHPLINNGTLDPGARDCATVFWLATTVNPLLAEQYPERVAADLLEFQTALSHLPPGESPRVVLVSSGGTIYGNATPPHREIDVPRPTSAYGAAKLKLEVALQAWDAQRAVIARVANAYGPGQPVAPGQGVIAHWLRAARRREPIQVYGGDRVIRDFVFVKDVAAALALLHRKRIVPRVVNIGSGRPTDLRTLAEVTARTVGITAVEPLFLPARTFDLAASWLDVALAQESLGWTPGTSLAEGLAESWAAVRSLGDPMS